MSTIKLPYWLLSSMVVLGAEDDPTQGDGNGGKNDDDHEDDDGDTGDVEGVDKLPDTHPLKIALKKEREANRANSKELRRLQREAAAAQKAKDEQDLAEKSELEQATIKLQKAEERANALAAGYLKSSLDRAIEQAAREAHFIDPNDAITSIARDSISFEQDENDPSRVTIDPKTVKAAVKALADKKPHWVSSGTDDNGATGSKFSGTPPKNKKTDAERLAELYPSLR